MARRTRFDLIKEAEAAAKEKSDDAPAKKAKAKSKSKAKSTSRSKTATKPVAAGGRMKAVWNVIDPNFKTVATFEYREKAEAEKKAADLTKTKGKTYLVRPDRVPFDG